MSEIHAKLIEIKPGDSFLANEYGAFVITESHTIRDVLRHLISECGANELVYHAKDLAVKNAKPTASPTATGLM